MVNQHIKNLLILQDRDLVVRRIMDQLESIPKGIEAHEGEIRAEEEALANSKLRLQELEIRRNGLETQVGSAEGQISKYKNQQLQVKKNEEFQALTHEIEILEQKISVWEEEEIGLLLDSDAETEVFNKREAVFDDSVAKIRKQIDVLETRMSELENELIEARARMEEAQSPLGSKWATTYDRLASRMKLPVVAAIESQKCMGCHLRISNDALEQARKGEALTTCDNCGRIVYLAS